MPQLSRAELNSLGINPGQFRHRITLLEPTKTTAKSGIVVTYSPSSPPVQLWARITPLASEEILRFGLDITRQHAEIMTRYDADVDATKRIQAPNGTVYVITSINNVLQMNAYLTMLCVTYGPTA